MHEKRGAYEDDPQDHFSQTIIAPNGTWKVVRHFRFGFGGPVAGKLSSLSKEIEQDIVRVRNVNIDEICKMELYLARPNAVSARSMVVSCPNSRKVLLELEFVILFPSLFQ